MLEGPRSEDPVRSTFCLRHASLALLVLSVAAAPAAAEPLDVRGLPEGAVLEAYASPDLGQTILLFARFADDHNGPASITIHDAEGVPRATLAGTIEAGAMMIVWDGRGENGEPLPAGVYLAELVTAEQLLIAELVLP
jgi:hypothetical protein